VKIYTDEGLTGLGEGGINGKELALKGLVDTYRPVLVGMDPASPARRRRGGVGGLLALPSLPAGQQER
jgi:L-alanine-DL-glutamate epimerase-like enolase superfamily enzyme